MAGRMDSERRWRGRGEGARRKRLSEGIWMKESRYVEGRGCIKRKKENLECDEKGEGRSCKGKLGPWMKGR